MQYNVAAFQGSKMRNIYGGYNMHLTKLCTVTPIGICINSKFRC